MIKPGDELRKLRLSPNEIRKATTPAPTFDVEALAHWVDRDCHEMRKDLRQFLNNDLFIGRYHDSLADMRALALQRLKKLCEVPGRFVSVKDFQTDPRRIFAAHEITCQVDGSFATKLTVQFNLFGGTVLKLGTDRHHDILNKIDSVQEIGSFALTELGYGNNAMKLETTATYDEQTQEFIINTPTPLAQKYWITNGAIDCHWCIVFAQTFVRNKHEGVQAFLVRVRDSNLRVSKGCTIEDMGRKLGQNGVDNAKLSFKQVRIPRQAMLNRVANVDETGTLTSKIASPRGRFIAALNQLLSGRLCLSSKGVGRAKQALVIAVRYAATRLCVGESGESDTPILSYQLQQRALLPLIARTYAISVVGMTYVKNLFATETCANGSKGLGVMRPETEVLCSGIKSLNCWHAKQTILVCRERCGGQGFLAANKFEEMIGDALAIETAEGDSSVLMMKVAKERLSWGLPKPLLSSTFQGKKELMNPHYLVHLFHLREEACMVELQAKMDADKKQHISVFETWQGRVSDQVQHLAKAYVERVCLEQFVLESNSHVKIQPVLQRLACLFALDVLHTEMGWFLTRELISMAEARALPELLRDLCGHHAQLGMADWALHLVDAFSVPEHLLPPCARDWVSYNEVNNVGELRNVTY